MLEVRSFTRLLLGALCLSSCGPAAREVPTALKTQAVVGGQHETRYPAAGYMLYGEPLDGPYCTLTLVSPRIALTAAHCVHVWSDDTLEGEFNVNGPTYLGIGLGDAMSSAPTSVRRVWIHPGYDTLAKPFSFYHDVALLFLSESVPLKAYPTIAPLPPGETPRSVGYGGTVSGGPDVQEGSSGERKSTAQQILNISALGYRGAGTDGGICWGDSGGPLLSEDGRFIYGVTSRHAGGGTPACTVGGEGTWVNLSNEQAALEQAIAEDDGGVGYLNAKFKHLGGTDTSTPTTPAGCQTTPHLAGLGLLAAWLLLRRK